MNIPAVKQFFNNKVTIRLKNGHRFEGLLSQINYKNQSLTLEDVEDLGNETDKNFIPHDKKIVEKAFECDNIEQIMFKEKHFCQAKKYNKDEFWDAVSEPVAQQSKYKEKSYGQRNQKPYYKKNYYDNRDNRDNRDTRGGDNRRRQGNTYNRGGNNYRNYDNKERTYDNRERNYDNNERNYDKNERNYDNKERTNDTRRREENPREEQTNDRDYR